MTNWYALGRAHREQYDPQPTFADLFMFLFGIVSFVGVVSTALKLPWLKHWLSQVEL